MYRQPKKKELVGKTIKRVDASSENMLILYFTDGTDIRLEAEYLGVPGLYGVCVWDSELIESIG